MKFLREAIILALAVLAGWAFETHQIVWFSFNLACAVINLVQYVKGE